MTFTEIVDDVCDRLNFTDPTAIARVGVHVNRRYRRVTSSIGLAGVSRRVILTHTPAPGTRVQTITTVEKVTAVFTEANPTKALEELTYDEMQMRVPTDGEARAWAVKRVGASSVILYFDTTFSDSGDLIIEAEESATTLSGTTEPAFPESYHDILVFGALADEYRKKEKIPLARDAENDYERVLSELRLHIAVSGYKDIVHGKENVPVSSAPAGSSGGGGGSSDTTDLGWINPCDAPFDCTGDGIVDDSAAFQAAVTSATCLFLPAGKIFNIGTTTINLHAGLTIVGADQLSSRIKYTGTGSALRYTSPAANSSGYGQITLRDFGIQGTSGANVGAGIDLKAGGFAFFHLDHLYITGGFKYGIVLDQAEVSTVTRCIIENTGPANSAHIWLTDGDEWRSGASVGFTNVITISDNQLNGAVYGIADDGGANHYILRNNCNSNGIAIRVAGAGTLTIDGNSLENTSALGTNNILFTDTSIVGGGSTPNKGICKGFRVSNNFFSMNVTGSNAMLAFSSAALFHEGGIVTGNIFGFKLGRGSAIDVTKLRWSQCAFNSDEAPNTFNHYTGTHNNANGNVLFTPGDSLEADEWLFGRSDIAVRMAGDTKCDTGVYERSRTARMGEFTSYVPTRTASAGTWTAGTVSCSYALTGKMLTVRFYITGTTVSNANVSLAISLPAGMTTASPVANPCIQKNAGAAYANTGIADTQAATTKIDFTILYGATFGIAATNTDIIGELTLEIQ